MREKRPQKVHREEKQGRWIGLCGLPRRRKYEGRSKMKKKKGIENK